MGEQAELTDDEKSELRAASATTLSLLLAERTGELEREVSWQESSDRALAQMIAVLAAGAAVLAWSYSGLGPRADAPVEKAALLVWGAAYLLSVGFAMADMIRAFVEVGFNLPRAGREWEATFLSALRSADESADDQDVADGPDEVPAGLSLRKGVEDRALRDYLVTRIDAFTEAVGLQRSYNRRRDAILVTSWTWVIRAMAVALAAAVMEIINRLLY